MDVLRALNKKINSLWSRSNKLQDTFVSMDLHINGASVALCPEAQLPAIAGPTTFP